MPARTANERFKERWSACVAWSMTAAAAAHLAVFAGWPAHEVSEQRPNAQWMAAQLVPIASPAIFPEPPAAALPDNPAPERPREVVREPIDVENNEPLEEIALPPPKLAYSRQSLPADALPVARIIAPGSAATTGVTLTTPAFTWPELRNPRAVVRFLRRGYNPLALESVPERFVTLAISISARGVVSGCEVYGSSGHPALDELALTVINEVAQFTPGSIRGSPIPVVVLLSIPFEQPW